MRRIIETLLEEGIDEQMVHRVLDLIEEEYDVIEEKYGPGMKAAMKITGKSDDGVLTFHPKLAKVAGVVDGAVNKVKGAINKVSHSTVGKAVIRNVPVLKNTIGKKRVEQAEKNMHSALDAARSAEEGNGKIHNTVSGHGIQYSNDSVRKTGAAYQQAKKDYGFNK